MMTKICTDVEQSNKLIELGIDVNTADMCYHFIEINKTPICIRWEKVHDDEKDNSIPAWSLTALLKLMPKSTISTPNPFCDIYCCRNIEFNMECYADNPVDAAFEMLVWLKENNLKEK